MNDHKTAILLANIARGIGARNVPQRKLNTVFAKLWETARDNHKTMGLKSYNTMLACFAKFRRKRWARQILGEMHERSIRPDIATFTGALQLAETSSEAISVLTVMKKTGITPDDIFYKTLLTSLKHDPATAKRVFKNFKPTNRILYDAYLLQEWCEPIETLHELEARGIEPTISTYTSALRHRAPSQQADVLDLMAHRGHIGMIDDGFMSVIIKNSGSVPELRRVLTDCASLGVTLTPPIVFSALSCVRACLSDESTEDVVMFTRVLFHKALLEGSLVSTHLYKPLMEIFVEAGSEPDAKELLEQLHLAKLRVPEFLLELYRKVEKRS